MSSDAAKSERRRLRAEISANRRMFGNRRMYLVDRYSAFTQPTSHTQPKSQRLARSVIPPTGSWWIVHTHVTTVRAEALPEIAPNLPTALVGRRAAGCPRSTISRADISAGATSYRRWHFGTSAVKYNRSKGDRPTPVV